MVSHLGFFFELFGKNRCLFQYLYRNKTNSKCPLCQKALDTIDESWVLAELPKMNEVNEKIVSELDELAYSSSSDENDPPNQNVNGGNWI